MPGAKGRSDQTVSGGLLEVISVLTQRTWQWSGSGHVMEQSLLHTVSPMSGGHLVTDLPSPREAGSHWALGEASVREPEGVGHMHFPQTQLSRAQ